jgi:2-dehydro-3-deoxyphosphogalactonate aldolase
MSHTFEEVLRNSPIIAILRGVTPDEVLDSCKALAEGGIKLMEITMNSPEAIVSIKKASEYFAESDVLIGAGTVLTPKEVDEVKNAGGQYIVSPNTNVSVIKRTKEIGLISCPGFMTPSEGFNALEAGADYLKCFPAGTMGSSYIKDIKAVIKAPIVSTGGINADNAEEFLNLSTAIGVGSSLYKKGDNTETLKIKATELTGKLIG